MFIIVNECTHKRRWNQMLGQNKNIEKDDSNILLHDISVIVANEKSHFLHVFYKKHYLKYKLKKSSFSMKTNFTSVYV